MDELRWRRIEELFTEALEIPAASRAAFLAAKTGADESLRREVEALLECDRPGEALIESPTGLLQDVGLGMEGRRAGPFLLTRLIGEGGMGAVYEGVREGDEFEMRAAVKVLPRGMDSAAMLARFRQERQILARLEHPFIARFLDGGATSDGLPYFAMEYVDGAPITSYCNARGLSIEERLRLFRLVCEAVQFAHQNLVVHRDIKPSNILVTREGVPKLLDFGIAKVLEQGPAVATTWRELRIFTPDYASPEQARGGSIGTGSDIYSLGAVLYELLSGAKPHRFASESLEDMERTIVEEEPEKPSAVAPAALRRDLEGDIDKIVAMAMRKESQRRYSSAAELAEDIRRHLEGLPVAAHENNRRYRAAKFIRRNRLAVGAAVLLALSLVAGIAASTLQARRAERRFQLVRELAHSLLHELHDEVEKLPGSLPARGAMVQTVTRYLDRLAQDSTDPRLNLEIGRAYFRVASIEGHPNHANLGKVRLAREHTQRAMAIFESLTNEADTKAEAFQELVITHVEAAIVEEALGRRADMEAHLRKAVAMAEEAARQDLRLKPDSLVSLHLRLADAVQQRGDAKAELENVAKAVEIAQEWAAREPARTVLNSLRDATAQLANAHVHAGQLEQARQAFEETFRVSERLMRLPDSDDRQRYGLIGVHRLFGDVLGAPDAPNLGLEAEAAEQYRQAIALGELLVAKQPHDATARRKLADAYCRMGWLLTQKEPQRALEIFEKATKLAEDLLAAEPENMQNRGALADALIGVGRWQLVQGKAGAALLTLARATGEQEALELASPDSIWIQRGTSQVHRLAGEALALQGERDHALARLQVGLAAADRVLAQAPGSLYHQMDRADAWESLGTLGAGREAASPDWKRRSLALWQSWKREGKALLYADKRIQKLAKSR